MSRGVGMLVGVALCIALSAGHAMAETPKVRLWVDPVGDALAVTSTLPAGTEFVIEYKGSGEDSTVVVTLWPAAEHSCESKTEPPSTTKQYHSRFLGADNAVFSATFPPLQADLQYCVKIVRHTALGAAVRKSVAASVATIVKAKLGSSVCDEPTIATLAAKLGPELQKHLRVHAKAADVHVEGNAGLVIATEVVGQYAVTPEALDYDARSVKCRLHQDEKANADTEEQEAVEQLETLLTRRLQLEPPTGTVWVAGRHTRLVDLLAGGYANELLDVAIEQLKVRRNWAPNDAKAAFTTWIKLLTKRKGSQDKITAPTLPAEMEAWHLWVSGEAETKSGLIRYVLAASAAARSDALNQIRGLKQTVDRDELAEAIAALDGALKRTTNVDAAAAAAEKAAASSYDRAVAKFESLLQSELANVVFVYSRSGPTPARSKTPATSSRFSVDVGWAAAFSNVSEGSESSRRSSMFFYTGVNVHLASVQREIAFDQLYSCSWFHRLRQRTSLTLGFTLTDPAFEGVELEKTELGFYPIVAAGYRLSHHIRVVGGAVMFEAKSNDDFSKGTSKGIAGFVALSLDIDAYTELKKKFLP